MIMNIQRENIKIVLYIMHLITNDNKLLRVFVAICLNLLSLFFQDVVSKIKNKTCN